jgi:hypothetical protein
LFLILRRAGATRARLFRYLNQQKCTRRRDIIASSTKVCRAGIRAQSLIANAADDAIIPCSAEAPKNILDGFARHRRHLGQRYKSCLLSIDYGTTRWPVDRLDPVNVLQGKSGDF